MKKEKTIIIEKINNGFILQIERIGHNSKIFCKNISELVYEIKKCTKTDMGDTID